MATTNVKNILADFLHIHVIIVLFEKILFKKNYVKREKSHYAPMHCATSSQNFH